MDWIEGFYDAQLRLAPQLADDRDLTERFDVLEAMGVPGGGRLLELGAGAGQFAAAAAERWHVVAVELVGALARRAAARVPPPSEVIEGDFYALQLPTPFDVVAYFDGFGVGTDADQRRLLQRIAGWLAPGGVAAIELYSPWFWAGAAGREHALGPGARRRYGFDADGCRMIDTWWSTDDPGSARSQSLRCYSPADLRLLLQGTGLVLDAVHPGGTLDASGYRPRAELAEALSWHARLSRA